jgi:hypothetical protein
MIFALFLRDELAKDENGICASVYHDEGRFECRTRWTSLNVFTTASTLVTWRRCSQPCTRMSFGQMAWKADRLFKTPPALWVVPFQIIRRPVAYSVRGQTSA